MSKKSNFHPCLLTGYEAYEVLKTKEFTVVNDCFQNEYNEKITDVNKTVESQLLSVKGIFNEQLSQSSNEFSEKITDVNKTIEKKIAAIKNDFSTNINEINEKLKNTNLNKS